jgi:hypothetical protein
MPKTPKPSTRRERSGDTPKPARDTIDPSSPENLGQEGEQSTIKKNTTDQGRRQDRI